MNDRLKVIIASAWFGCAIGSILFGVSDAVQLIGGLYGAGIGIIGGRA